MLRKMVQCAASALGLVGAGSFCIWHFPAFLLSTPCLIAQAQVLFKAVNRKASNQQYSHSRHWALPATASVRRADAAQQCFFTHGELLKLPILQAGRLLWYVFVIFEAGSPSASNRSSSVYLAAFVLSPPVRMLMCSTASAPQLIQA